MAKMLNKLSVADQIKEVIDSTPVGGYLRHNALRAVARFERVPWLPDKMRLALNQYYVPPFLLSPDGRVSRSNIDEELMIINIPMVLDTYYLLVDPPQGNLYSIDQAAAYLNMEPQSIQDAVAHQELPLAHQDGEQARIAQSDLDQFRRKHLLMGVR
jgi:excisionase family DNA binding protein